MSLSGRYDRKSRRGGEEKGRDKGIERGVRIADKRSEKSKPRLLGFLFVFSHGLLVRHFRYDRERMRHKAVGYVHGKRRAKRLVL
jgi:hypothetical protein